jgi:thiamine-monophosphate kinase
LEEIGWRAAAAALSDLAAEAATPIGVLASVGVPPDVAEDAVARVMDGVAAAAASVEARVLGGDLSRAPVWILDVTVLGAARTPVRRRGARPGDMLWVTGTLGGARAALVAWQAGAEPVAEARRAFARPEPRVVLGQLLAAHGARAMLDLSDGLAGDAGHLAAASAVALEIDLDALPLSPAVSAAARGLDEPEVAFAARGGEDYELLVALPPEFGRSDAIALTFQSGVALTPIGRVLAGGGVRLLSAGKLIEVRGFDHFG